jgi:hypothetical protein
VKSGFVLLSRDGELIAVALQAAAAVDIELRLLDDYPVISATEFLIADPKALIDNPTLKPDVLISAELTDSIWRFAAAYAPAQLIQLPQATSWFQTWLTNQHLTKSPLISLRSVSAAAGSSALAVALGYTAAIRQDVVLVDLDHARSAMSLLSSIDLTGAVSWEQLTNLTGLPAGSALFAGLPNVGKLKLLSFGSLNITNLSLDLIESVIALLREQAQLVVVDLGQLNAGMFHRTQLDKSILVAPCNLLGVSKLKTQSTTNQIVLRVEAKSGLSKADAQDYLQIDNLLSYKSDPRFQLDIADSVIPAERKNSELRKIATKLLAGVNAN